MSAVPSRSHQPVAAAAPPAEQQQGKAAAGKQSRQLCALYGLIRYESSSGSSSSTPAPVLAVARLCGVLHAMCHSDGQRLLQGRQATALLDLPQAVVAGTGSVGRAGSASTLSVGHSPITPITPVSPFVPTPHTHASSTGKSGAAQAGGLVFPSVPTFHQATYTLVDASATLMPLNAMPPTQNAQLAQDIAYLTDRERRLQPIVSLVAAPTAWSLLVPPRFSRYVRVYRPVAPAAPGTNASELHKEDMLAWREVELPSFAPVPTFHGVASLVSPPTPSTSGAAHESWRLSYLGKAMLPTKSLCHVRPIRVTPVSTNYVSFLEHNSAVAYERDYEYVQEGFRFEDRDGIEILVYQVLKVRTEHAGAGTQRGAQRGRTHHTTDNTNTTAVSHSHLSIRFHPSLTCSFPLPALSVQMSTPGLLSSAATIRGNRWICEVRSLCPEDIRTAQQVKVQAYAKAMEQHVRFTKLTPEGIL